MLIKEKTAATLYWFQWKCVLTVICLQWKYQKSRSVRQCQHMKTLKLICILSLSQMTVDGSCESTPVLLPVSRHHFAPDPLCESSSLDFAPHTHARTHVTFSPQHDGSSSLQQIFMKWREERAALHSSAASATPQPAPSHLYLCLSPLSPSPTRSGCFTDTLFVLFSRWKLSSPPCCHIKAGTSSLVGPLEQSLSFSLVWCRFHKYHQESSFWERSRTNADSSSQ